MQNNLKFINLIKVKIDENEKNLKELQHVFKAYEAYLQNEIMGDFDLRLLLKENSVTQSQLARALGVSRQQVQTWCTGVKPVASTITKIIAAIEDLKCFD